MQLLRHQRVALQGLVLLAKFLFGCALLAFIIFCLTACKSLGGNTRAAADVTASQAPGSAVGAGASLVGPTNAAGETTQTAHRRVGYYPQPTLAWPLPTSGIVAQPSQPAPAPAWIDEKVETTIAAHQDVAVIVKVAEEANRWSKTRWIGICLVIGAIIFALYYRGTDGGYPMVYAKVICIGTVLAIVDPSPWWLCSLIIPALFYVAQKLKLINLPALL